MPRRTIECVGPAGRVVHPINNIPAGYKPCDPEELERLREEERAERLAKPTPELAEAEGELEALPEVEFGGAPGEE